MVVISGRAGRTTAGEPGKQQHVASSLAGIAPEVPAERVYIARTPPLVLDRCGLKDDRQRGSPYRQIWFNTRVCRRGCREMFADYPAFRPGGPRCAHARRSHRPWVSSPPALLDDRLALITRLRFVMEDPAQQLSTRSPTLLSNAGRSDRSAAVSYPGLRILLIRDGQIEGEAASRVGTSAT